MPTSLDPDDVSKTLGLDRRGGLRTAGRWVGLFAVVAMALVVWLVWQSTEQPTIRYVTAPVARDALSVRVTAVGTLEPTDTVEISSELSGMIDKVLVDHNSQVKAGEVLAELDTDKLEAELAHARATLLARQAKVMEAKATVGEAEQDFRRYEQLVERRATTEQSFEKARATLERARAALASAKAEVAVAEADLELQETNLAKACICSPIEGIVLRRNVDEGQIIASSLQAPTLFTLAADLSQMELRVDVDEADISLVAEGQAAQFAVDAYPNRTFPAHITRVRFAPDTTESVVTYQTELSVDNGDLALRPGMTATAEILARRIEDALLIPNEALRFVPPEAREEDAGGLLSRILPRPPRRTASSNETVSTKPNEKQVYILDGDVPTAVMVTIGLSDGERTEIVDGPLTSESAVLIDYRDGG